MNCLDIYVRYSAGAYSCRSGKLTASSTMSGKAAAERLAEKVFGPAFQRVDQVGNEVNCASRWTAIADATIKAWCWATGLIEFGTDVPEDAVQIAAGPDRALRQVVGVFARHGIGKSAGQLLVPGLPEAKNQRDGMTELMLWVNRLAIENGNPKRLGVVFSREWSA